MNFMIVMSDNDDLIADKRNPMRPKWVAKTIQVAGNPRDSRRTRSQFESALSVKDPFFSNKCFLMIESDPYKYEYSCEY